MPHSQDATRGNSNNNDSEDNSNRINITNELKILKEASWLSLNAFSYISSTDEGIVSFVKAQPINNSNNSASNNSSGYMLFYL